MRGPVRMKGSELFACTLSPEPAGRKWLCPGPKPEHAGCDVAGWDTLSAAAEANGVVLTVSEVNAEALGWDLKIGSKWYGPAQVGNAQAFLLSARSAAISIAECLKRNRS